MCFSVDPGSRPDPARREPLGHGGGTGARGYGQGPQPAEAPVPVGRGSQGMAGRVGWLEVYCEKFQALPARVVYYEVSSSTRRFLGHLR